MEEGVKSENKGLRGRFDSVQVRKGVEKVLDITGLSEWLTYSSVASNVLFVLFMVFLVVLHIANTHMAERMVRKINQKEKQLKELRWEYVTSKSELMYNSKQSELAEKLKETDLIELREPPYKILAD